MFRFDQLLSLGIATLACSGTVGIAVGTFRNVPGFVLGASALFLVFAMGLVLLRRALRLRARAELVSWLPQTRAQGHARGWGSDWHGLWNRDELAADDRSGAMQLTRSGARDAASTRAVVASLQEAMRTEMLADRPPRPACRRARLRELGRAPVARSRRRAPSARPDTLS